MISVCIPYVRPKLIPPLIEKIKSRSGMTYSDLEILAEEDVDRIGCPKMLKKLVDKSSGDYICFIGDDTDPQENFLSRAMWDMVVELKCNGLVGLNDRTGRTLSIHWVASKSLLPTLGGEFFHTGYNHCFCDIELMERCKAINKYYYSPTAVVLHNHPQWDKSIKRDKHYLRAYRKDRHKADKALFYHRKKNGWVT